MKIQSSCRRDTCNPRKKVWWNLQLFGIRIDRRTDGDGHWPIASTALTATRSWLFHRWQSRTSSNGSWTLLHVWSLRLGSLTVVCHSYCTTICTGWMFLSGCSTSWRWWPTVVWDGEPRRTSPITACRSQRFLVASICDPPVAVNSSFRASVAALSVLVFSPLRAQQFGILCLTVCVIQLLGLISFDVTWKRICLCDIASCLAH